MIALWQMVGVASPGRDGISLSNEVRPFGEALNRLCLSFPLSFGLLLFFTMVAAGAANAPAPKRVLILHSFGRAFSPFCRVATTFETELAQHSQQIIEFQEASLGSVSTVSGASDEAVTAYIRAMSASRKPDLIVPFGGPAVRFMLRERSQLFPSTPLLLTAVETRHIKAFELDTNTVAVPASFDLPGVVSGLLGVFPATTNIAVVLGHSALEAFWRAETQREFAQFTNRIRFAWLDQLTLPEMEQHLAHLPPNSAVFFMSIFADAANVPYRHDTVLETIHAAANAPIVGLFEEDIGMGILGGRLVGLEEQGRATAQLALRILNGESLRALQTTPVLTKKSVYDGRELKRWNVSEASLPGGSEVRFREPSFARKYRWHILVAVGICAVEAVLIGGLIHALHRRRQTEKSLRESEERMKLAASAAELGMWEWDLRTDQVWVTGRSVERIGSGNGGKGYQSDYSQFMRTVHPEDRNSAAAAVAKAIHDGGEYENVHRRIQANGQVRWVAARGRVEFDTEHKPVRMRGVGLDITSRKEAEDRARESEKRFLLMANAAPVLIWTSGPDKLCTFINQPWLEFTGRTLEQEIGEGWAQGIHPDDHSQRLRTYEEAFDARLPFTMEYRLRRRDGEYRWLSDHGVPRYDENHNFLGYIGSCLDLTVRKQAEVEAQRSRQEMAHVSRLATLGELAGSIAHELNQPLTAILSNAQAAQRFLNGSSAEPGEVREILKDIAEEGRRAGDIILGIRAMLKKDPGQMQPMDVNTLIKGALTIIHSDLIIRQVSVVTRLAAGRPGVKGDRVQFQQVLLNLILNACDAMAELPAGERQLTIDSELHQGGEVQVSVADNGPGFTPEIMGRLFEPFRTSKPNGLGLGLAICRSIIHAHGGRFWVEAPASKGGIVRFTLPAIKEAA